MSIWTDPAFQYRVRNLLIYAIEFIETDAECYRESNEKSGDLDGLEQQIYDSEMEKVAQLAHVLAQIDEEWQQGGSIRGNDVDG